MIWHPITQPPESHEPVLMAIHGEKNAAEGFLSHTGTWRYTDASLVMQPVYAWADMPDCPAQPFTAPAPAPRNPHDFLDSVHSLGEAKGTS